MRRFPNIKMIVSHGGGTVPHLLTLEPLSALGGTMLTLEEIQDRAAWFYYDLAAATSKVHLTAPTEIAPASRLLAGSDVPFIPVAMMSAAMQEIHAGDGFEDHDVANILLQNAATLFPAVESAP